MKVDDQMTVTLTISRTDDEWWQVSVPDQTDTEFASASARTLEHALRGAVPYIACVVEDASDAVAQLFRRVDAQNQNEASP